MENIRYLLRQEMLNFKQIFPNSKMKYLHLDHYDYPILQLLDENNKAIMMIETFGTINRLVFTKNYTNWTFLNIELDTTSQN